MWQTDISASAPGRAGQSDRLLDQPADGKDFGDILQTPDRGRGKAKQGERVTRSIGQGPSFRIWRPVTSISRMT